MHTRHFTLIALAFSLATCSMGCSGELNVGSAEKTLFDESRTDVRPLFDESRTEQVGLINRTHRLVWHYELGFAQLADEQGNLRWGFLPHIPESIAGQLLDLDDEATLRKKKPVDITWDEDGTGNYRCVTIRTENTTIVVCFPKPSSSGGSSASSAAAASR